MSNDILVLNESGEEVIGESSLVGEEEQEEDKSTSIFKQPARANKKGFRIDDILFSVSNNVLRNQSCMSVVSSSPRSSESSICSSNSSSLSLDEMSPVLYLHDEAKPCKEIETPLNNSPPIMMSRTRSRSLSPSMGHSSSNYPHACQDSMSLYASSPNEAKKPRTSFSPDQIQALEDSFQEKRYLNHTERMILAEELNLTDCQIKTWFQNRRMKMKRQYKEAVDKGYLIPYHPYPFPRYSRLTPAHFASLPTLNARRFIGKPNSSRLYSSPPSNSTSSGCHCCSSGRSYTQSRESYMRGGSLSSCGQGNCSDYIQNRPRRGSDVLPSKRCVERRDMQYDNEFNDYFRHLPSRASESGNNRSNNAPPSTAINNITDRNKKFL